MSLQEYLETEINAAKAEVERTEEERLQRLKSQYEQRVAELQRTYDYEITQEVETRVNRELFARSQKGRFDTLSSIQDELNQAYREFIPKLLESSWFTEELETFLDTVPPEAAISVRGGYRDTLYNQLTSLRNIFQPSLEEGEGLGSIVCETSDKRWELSLEALLERLKERTLPRVRQELDL